MGLICGKMSDMVILVLICFRFVQSAIIKNRLLHGVDSVHYWRVKNNKQNSGGPDAILWKSNFRSFSHRFTRNLLLKALKILIVGYVI